VPSLDAYLSAGGIGRAAQIKSNAFKDLDTDKDGTVSWTEHLPAQ
jgi:hypothetical protein